MHGAPVTLITTRAIIIAIILHMRREVFNHTFKDGSYFRASESFVRKFLHGTLAWSIRRATQAAQKKPIDWEDQCENSFFRQAYIIEEHMIPDALRVNSDQTQVVYAPGNKMTWTTTGDKQVAVVGTEEKRAFTLLVSVVGNGSLLPFQAIYQGLTKRSLPNETLPAYKTATSEGNIKFEYSGTSTYWSNQTTMQKFVDTILAPYFENTKKDLKRPPHQKSLWLIDVWSVHRSVEFREWMHANHPNIIICYVPGGCTGVHQPCDVGIQRLLKLSIRKSYHEDVVEEFVGQLEKGITPNLDDRLGTLRNRSVRWMQNAFNAINDRELIKKVLGVSKSRSGNIGLQMFYLGISVLCCTTMELVL